MLKQVLSCDQKKTRESRSNVKVLLMVFLMGSALFIMSFFHVARQLMDNFTCRRDLRGGEMRPGCCTITHLLTRCSSSMIILVKHKMTVIPQQPYSPDFFLLFPKLKSTLKGCRFQIEELEKNSLWDLHAIPQNAFQNGEKRWKWCIDSGGEYSEGYKSY
ncbi:hypothetical protein B7P43_G17921 [Cryptotermes secundus]|uniref:Uncharacterized protein n=1 Tax=Cryptotermes secundus TaxID=105785 RepID=A0A2J7PTB3_9NEOP|nr:hypothetical protein B7P43_G17921 [Cryptotermes secundus]